MPVGNAVGRGISSMPVDVEAMPLEPLTILARRREAPWNKSRAVDAAARQHRLQRHDDCGHVAMASEFGDETPAGAQRARDACYHGVRIGLHPMQGGIGEDGIELAGERQGGTVDEVRVSATIAGLSHHIRGCVDTDNRTAELGQPQGKHAVAAAKVENSLARLRRQQLHHGRTQIGDKSGIGRVASGVPFLAGR